MRPYLRSHHVATTSKGTVAAQAKVTAAAATRVPWPMRPTGKAAASRRPYAATATSTASCTIVPPTRSQSRSPEKCSARWIWPGVKNAAGRRCGGVRSPGTLVRPRKKAATSHTASPTANVAPRPMRVAVISDIHGNVHALEAVLQALESERTDALWCLGDLVGYGPQPNRCTTSVAARAELCLVGNHDLAALGRLPIEDFSPDAATSAEWTRGVLTDETRSFLEQLEPQGTREGVQLFHGSPRDPVWDYVLSAEAARGSFEETTAPLILVGHSHAPLAIHDSLSGGLAPGGTERTLDHGRWLLNPGSVGQPRDGDPRAAYLVLDLDAHTAVFRRVAYDVERTQAEIAEAGLPRALAERLAV